MDEATEQSDFTDSDRAGAQPIGGCSDEEQTSDAGLGSILPCYSCQSWICQFHPNQRASRWRISLASPQDQTKFHLDAKYTNTQDGACSYGNGGGKLSQMLDE